MSYPQIEIENAGLYPIGISVYDPLNERQKHIKNTNTVSITLVVYMERELLEIYQHDLPSTKIKHYNMNNRCDPIGDYLNRYFIILVK